MNTKQKIIEEALTLFSTKGYDAVSVGEIAAAVGIKAPSLYKHYKSKQEILQAVLEEMNQRYHKQAVSNHMDGTEADKDMDMFQNLSSEELYGIARDLFLFFRHDTYSGRFRKMLTIGQYENREMADLFSKQYVDDPLAYQESIFAFFMQMGLMQDGMPKITAIHFYAPIYLLITMCDRQPEREEEALELLQKHVEQFGRLYKKTKD